MKSFSLALYLALIAMPALAWGPEGHDVIANVAYQRLSPDLQAKFDKTHLENLNTLAAIIEAKVAAARA